jgi:hypothetical protein
MRRTSVRVLGLLTIFAVPIQAWPKCSAMRLVLEVSVFVEPGEEVSHKSIGVGRRV